MGDRSPIAYRSGYGTTRSGGERCSAGRSYRSRVDRYAVVEVAAVWTTLAQAHKLVLAAGRNPVGLGVSMPGVAGRLPVLSLIHISEPTRLGMISYAVFCL